MKKKEASKKSSTSKSSKESSNIYMATEQVYHVALKSIVSSLVPHCPREILIELSKYINTIYPKLKDLCLNSVMENDTVKRRELAWKNVISKILNVLHPLLQAINTEQKPLLELFSIDPINDIVSTPRQDEHIHESILVLDHLKDRI